MPLLAPYRPGLLVLLNLRARIYGYAVVADFEVNVQAKDRQGTRRSLTVSLRRIGSEQADQAPPIVTNKSRNFS